MNVKTKTNCKTENYFLIMFNTRHVTFSMVGRIWIRDWPPVENRWSI